jgi:hypothetical protein
MTVNRQGKFVMLEVFVCAMVMILVMSADFTGAASSDKAITSFYFTSPAATGTINEAAKTISVIVPYGSDVTGLVATFTTTGATVKVNALTQISGQTPQNFTIPVSYVVWAVDSTYATYVVTVTLDAGSFKLPDTGQTLCYDAAGSVMACAGTGQDGDYIVNPMSFTDHGDGTITDNVTGLLWQKCSLGLSGSDCTTGTAALYQQYDSISACASLGSGWRVPTIYELRTIVDYGLMTLIAYQTYIPAINATYFPNTQANVYWSSTSYAYQPNYAWYVDFRDGNTYNAYKGTAYYVRCVRGQKVGD